MTPTAVIPDKSKTDFFNYMHEQFKENAVAYDLLEEGKQFEFISDFSNWMKDIALNGCGAGCVPYAIYYRDIWEKFSLYHIEIQEAFEDGLLDDWNKRMDFRTQVVWKVIEQTAASIYDETFEYIRKRNA